MGRVGTRSSASLYRRLVSCWRLEERDGYRYDSIGTNHLSVTGYVDVATGLLGDCAYFDTTHTTPPGLTIADNAKLRTGDIDFTVAAWVKLTDKTTYRCIASKWASGATEWQLIYQQARDRFYFSTGTDACWVTADTLGSPAVDTWYFVVAWHDAAANTISIQVNNGAVDTKTGATAPVEGTQAFSVGIRSDGQFRWAGYIDNVLFYRRTLTAAERATLYAAGEGMEMVQTPNQYRHLHADISAVGNYFYDAVRGGVLTLHNKSRFAELRLRDLGAGAYVGVDPIIRLTHPYEGTDTTIALLSDTHFGYAPIYSAACMTTAVNDLDANVAPDYVFVLGDITMDTDEFAAYSAVKAMSAVPNANWYEIPGNHDSDATFKTRLGYAETYYSLDIGNVRFLFLGGLYLLTPAVTWLEAQLAASADYSVILCTHEPRRYTTRESNNAGGGWLGVQAGSDPLETALAYGEWCAWLSGHSHGFNTKGAEAQDLSNYYFRED